MADGLADPCVPPGPDDASSGLLDITRLSVDSRPSEGEKAMEINWEWKGRESLSLEVRPYSAGTCGVCSPAPAFSSNSAISM